MFTVDYQPTKGEHRAVKLVLKSIADIGLVGYAWARPDGRCPELGDVGLFVQRTADALPAIASLACVGGCWLAMISRSRPRWPTNIIVRSTVVRTACPCTILMSSSSDAHVHAHSLSRAQVPERGQVDTAACAVQGPAQGGRLPLYAQQGRARRACIALPLATCCYFVCVWGGLFRRAYPHQEPHAMHRSHDTAAQLGRDGKRGRGAADHRRHPRPGRRCARSPALDGSIGHPVLPHVVLLRCCTIVAAQLLAHNCTGHSAGAHANLGMGHKFLRHIERTKGLIYVIDIGGFRLSQKVCVATA
jgi:hypothetical protein